MLAKNNHTEIQAAAELLGLSERTIEKDIYVTQLIHALAELNDPYYKLIFQGGTCLAKAHGIIPRMSEDCDFRIQTTAEVSQLSREKRRKTLRTFRASIFEKLTTKGFLFDKSNIRVRNEGRFINLRIEYDSNYQDVETLKPFLAVDFFLANVKTPVVALPITTLIKKTLGNQIPHSELPIDCVSVVETAAEKWIGLTRRIATIKYRDYYNDPMLVHHLYDLLKINQQKKLNKKFVELVNHLLKIEREKFKTHNAEYFKNPAQEIDTALQELSVNQEWRKNWQHFVEAMVFENNPPTYNEALDNFKQLTNLWLKKLYQ